MIDLFTVYELCFYFLGGWEKKKRHSSTYEAKINQPETIPSPPNQWEVTMIV